MKKIAVLSGAGISAESGISTFRDAGGLWEGYDIMEVASISGWEKNPALVLEFYNMRRLNMIEAEPNKAHFLVANLQHYFDVTVITQNVDNLHERAGSENIIHLHGELSKSRSTANPDLVYEIKGSQLNIGDYCELGSQLRPHIVWFGEQVDLFTDSINQVQDADILIIIGTSMVVYPAASLLHYAKQNTEIYYIDPNIPDFKFDKKVIHIKENATLGMEILTTKYLNI
ncbi:MAG: NAD-dependent deacylase [Bacteroidia bacterium]|nr:NAD-dependent deacylase [Bacteroidia bacterium]